MFQGRLGAGIEITRRTFLSPERRRAIDLWTLRNTGTNAADLSVRLAPSVHLVSGPYGTNHCEVSLVAPKSTRLQPGEQARFAVLFRAWLEGEPADPIEPVRDEQTRLE